MVRGVFCYFNISFNSKTSASNGTVGLSPYSLWKSMRRPELQIRFLMGYKEKMGNTISSDMESVYLGKVALLVLLKRNEMSKVSVCLQSKAAAFDNVWWFGSCLPNYRKTRLLWSLRSCLHTRL